MRDFDKVFDWYLNLNYPLNYAFNSHLIDAYFIDLLLFLQLGPFFTCKGIQFNWYLDDIGDYLFNDKLDGFSYADFLGSFDFNRFLNLNELLNLQLDRHFIDFDWEGLMEFLQTDHVVDSVELREACILAVKSIGG